MRVSAEDYSPFLSELSMFRVYLHATVDETDQLTATFADFRLILPQLEITVSYIHSGSDLSLILGVGGPGHLSPSVNPPFSFPVVDCPGGLGRASSPTAKHFDAIYAVKQRYK